MTGLYAAEEADEHLVLFVADNGNGHSARRKIASEAGGDSIGAGQ
jgi:hypothetical protein